MSNNSVDNRKIDVLFFERPLVDLRKFAFKIARNIKQIDSQFTIGAIALELPNDDEKNKSGIDYFYFRKEVKDIDLFLINHEVKIIVFTQSRIPDLEFILHAKKLGVKTVMVQEGVMFDGMNINDVSARNFLAIFKYIPKVFEYLNILIHMCRYDRKSFISLLIKILKLKKNITIIVANSFSVHLIGEYIFTMGDYWDDYYISKHGYSKSQIRLIGDHDLDGFIPANNNEVAICYIANVLVEDGTIKKNEFDDFLRIMSLSIDKNIKLYIKLHPRSDKTLYDILLDHNVEFVEKPGFLPSVTTYIGHRSALLGKALYESDNLIIWRFPNEEVCFYEKFATATCTNQEQLFDAMRNIDFNIKTNKKLEQIRKVYWNNPSGSMLCAARNIIDYIKKEVINE